MKLNVSAFKYLRTTFKELFAVLFGSGLFSTFF